MELVVQTICGALEISAIVFLLRRGSWREFPAFFNYLVFILFRAIICAVTLSNPSFYFYFYWISAPVEILLTVLAVLESFWQVFRIFQLLRWFRFVLPGAIAAALGYSAWQGYSFPPIETAPVTAALVNVTVAMHYVILAVVVLFFLLAVVLPVPWRVQEYRFMLGFGVASLAASFGGTIRALFGMHFDFVSREAQPIGYVVALLIWLSAVVHPVTEQRVVEGPSEEQLEAYVNGLKNQLHSVRSFVRKGRH